MADLAETNACRAAYAANLILIVADGGIILTR